jgi:hypothetical protein
VPPTPPTHEPPPPPPKPNLRRHPRFELLASVELHLGDETLILPARNLSLGGIYLGSDGHDLGAFPVGAALEVLVFDAVDEARPAVRAQAVVVRHEQAGMALRWKTDGAVIRELEVLLEALKPSARARSAAT